MSRYDNLYSAIAELYGTNQTPILVDAPKNFPFPKIYPGQLDILERVGPEESFCLSSHTGFGKTAVFMSLTRSGPSIVIEPRKFLQAQCSEYFKDFCLYGRSAYPCRHSRSAATAPCLTKESCDATNYHERCPVRNSTCQNKPCKIFVTHTMALPDPNDMDKVTAKNEYAIYPCERCDYIRASQEAIGVLKSGGCVICNFGNFWNLLRLADTVVVDEADLFFREISAPMKLKYSKPKDHDKDSIKQLLTRELQGLRTDMRSADSKFKYTLQNLIYSVQFLIEHEDLCFKYSRKDRIYVEIDPRNVNILSEKLFKGKRLVIVSATPGAFTLPSYSAQIHQRCGIYFAPVGNLTSKSLKANPYLMSSAAKAVKEISDYMDFCYDADKVVIHCGNLGTHAAGLFGILGEDQCVIHEAGRLAETITRYLDSGKKYLLVASAEYGGDFGWCKLQFVLKFPYPNLDERMRTLEKNMGPGAFRAYYEGEARTRVIQMAGRNVRGFNDFGITVCLDSKVKEDYDRNRQKYPAWFQSRVDERCY